MDHQQPLDYDSCTQFLARLDSDTQQATHDNLTSSESPTGDSCRSPFNSASPPGLSSGCSVTSHSPESLRFDWDPTENFFNDSTGILSDGGHWDSLMIQDQQTAGVSPMSDYIKIENEHSPGYFAESGDPQGTISPGSSLLDPTAQTALEGSYSFPKESDGLFNFHTYNSQPNSRHNSGDFSSTMMWRPPQSREEFQSQPQNWQQQQHQQHVAQMQHQQHQHQQPPPLPSVPQQPHAAQRTSPLRKSLSPSYTHSVSSPESRSGSVSDDNNAAPTPRTKKRKTSSDDAPLDPPQQQQQQQQPTGAAPANGRKQPKKTAHNMIEKRYRTNLNDKIAALRDSVPSLRVMAGTARLGEDDEEEDLEGLAPAHKLNKATVLAKATEYIRHLEKRNKRLMEENDQLKNRLNAFEKLATMGGGMGLQPQPGPHNGRGGQTGGPGGGLMSRLMVGSLAGLMIANGFQSHDDGSRQLSAFPFPVEWLGSAAPANNHLFLLIAKLVLLFTAVLYVITPGFFDSKEAPENAKASTNPVAAAPSLASPLKDRSHAWLTAIQTVWVPRHSISLELAALGIKAAKLSLRNLIGGEKYRMITGITEEQEAARIKSWTIALDAQLAGGDVTVNHPRLLLTLFASWTLPATPARLMLNALHICVLCSDLGEGLQAFANRFSNFYWLEARRAQKVAENDPSAEQLPENLAHLLQIDAADVFDAMIVQKAYNLTYNSTEDSTDEGMDSVVKDVTIRSPLDALAAWYSSLLLQGVLVASLKAKSSISLNTRIQTDLDTALRVAPPSSAAQLRALTAKAILVTDDSSKYLADAIKIFEEDFAAQERASVESSVTTTTDIRVSLHCGRVLALMRNGSRDHAICRFGDLDWRQADKNGLGLLGFVAAWKTLTTFVSWDENWATDAGESVERAAAMIRIWIGDKKIPKFGVSGRDCKRVIDFCNSLQKKLAGLEDGDDGYVSGGVEVERQQSMCV